MPSPPYAAVRASINAGALTSGGLTVAANDSIQLSGLDTSQWQSQRWELYGFPAGYPAPASWSTDAAGVYFSTSVLPPVFVMPDGISRWGKIGVRLTVDGGLKNGAANADMVDTLTSFSLLSLSGQREIFRSEESQFGGWWSEYQANLKTIESNIGHTGTTIGTTDATVTLLKAYTMATNSRYYILKCRVTCVGDTYSAAAVYDITVSYVRTSGGVLTVRASQFTALYESNAAFNVSHTQTGNLLNLNVTGAAATNLRWHLLQESFLVLKY